MLVTGCSTTKEAKPSDSATNGVKETTAAATATAVKKANITVSIYDRNNIPPEEGNWEKNRWVDWVNENGPAEVKYVTVPRWESLQKFNALFATKSAPDLILEYDAGYRNQWYGQKLLLPLDDIIDQYSTTYKDLMAEFPQLKKLGTKEDGKIYEIGKVTPLTAGHRIYIRQDWLTQLNLPMPTTTEEFLSVAKAFAEKDPDGNKKADTFGVNLSGNANKIINHMFGYGEVSWRFEGENFIHEWDRIKAGTDFQKQLFDAGVADKDFLADKNGEKAKQDFISGKLGIYLHQAISDKDYDAFVQNNPTGKLAIMTLPKSTFGQFSPVISSPIQMVGSINAQAKDPKAVMEYIDFMIKPENARTIINGIEGTHWKADAQGNPMPIDPEKNKIEQSYTGDLAMMSSTLLFGKSAFDANKPKETATQKALYDLTMAANSAYVSKDRPIPTLKPEYLPALPQDLSLIVKNTEQQIMDIWSKAIVSGKGYTADQALTDTKGIWEQSGGLKVDDFYAKWYVTNKDKAFLLSDLYSFGEQSAIIYGNK
ncbi:MAG: extracellular solute-binding protein [Gorillibacterium sp.]|nr:extracellular solute-binding protein [Gorillibacterium sp.]